MKRMMAILLLSLSLAAMAQELQPWIGSGFEKPRVRLLDVKEIYPEGKPTYAYQLQLTLIQFDKTNWTEARVLRHVRRTAAIFGACDIALDDVQLAHAGGPGGRHDVDMTKLYPGTDLPKDIVDLAALVPSDAAWPRAFLVGRLRGDEVLARAYRQGEVSDEEARRFPYMNTAWIAYRAHWEERAEEEYSSLAHELSHVLCRCGHSGGEERHLLHEKRNFLGARILEDDCRRMQESPLLRRVEGPRDAK